jgi:hypothetical protein
MRSLTTTPLRLSALGVLAGALLSCNSVPTTGTVSGDIYEIRLAVQEIEARQDSLSAEVRAARAAHSREIDDVDAHLEELRDAIDDLTVATERVRLSLDELNAQIHEPNIVRHQLVVPRSTDTPPTPPAQPTAKPTAPSPPAPNSLPDFTMPEPASPTATLPTN